MHGTSCCPWAKAAVHGKSSAVTLVELLVVVVIIAVLAGVLLPVFNGVIATRDRVTALSQMHQVAAALASYPADHNGLLPGPLYPGQMPMLDPARDGRLVLILASYLSITIPTTPQLIPLFIPPAYKRQVTAAFLVDARTYVMNMAVPNVGGAALNPWGNATLTPAGSPMPLAQVPSQAWAMCDADQLNPRVTTAPWKANTPPNIIHGTQRLALRFDGSAGQIDASELVLPP